MEIENHGGRVLKRKGLVRSGVEDEHVAVGFDYGGS